MPKETTNNNLSWPYLKLCASFVMFMMLLFSTRLEAAECAPFPESKWWKNLSHESVSNFVTNKHGGNWSEYLEKWEKQQDIVKTAYMNNSYVAANDGQAQIAGVMLRIHLYKTGRRVEITRCLAEKQMAKLENTGSYNLD